MKTWDEPPEPLDKRCRTAIFHSVYGCDVGHQGLFFDKETELYYIRARYLHPWLGRMNQRDSVGYLTGPSLYECLRSAPTSRVDPMGLLVLLLGTPYTHAIDEHTPAELQEMANAAVQELEELLAHDGQLPPELQSEYAMHLAQGLADYIEYLKDAAWRKQRYGKFECMYEATAHLKATVSNIRAEYNNPKLTAQQRCELCATAFPGIFRLAGHAVTGLSGAQTAASCWDIIDLHNLTERRLNTGEYENRQRQTWERDPDRWRSVQVEGRCYDAGAVNYVMLGVMGDLCKVNLADVQRRVVQWKGWAYGESPNIEVLGWLEAGYRGWPNAPRPHSDTPFHPVRYRTPAEERRRYVPVNSYANPGRYTTRPEEGFAFKWRPYIEGSPMLVPIGR